MARKEYENPKAEMTPMIDVVFQLMIFFVVTIKQEDILSKIVANRPNPNPNPSQTEENDDSIEIQIGPRGVVFKGQGVSIPQLDSNLGRLASVSKKSIIVIKCAADSHHGTLVQVLDICNKHDLQNRSVFSLD